jgi:hypothetical protein
MVIETSRWVVLQTETTLESIITHWITLWKQLSEWERLGGRTLHWAISTVCQQHYQLDVLMGTYSLVDDPSFKSFIPGGHATVVFYCNCTSSRTRGASIMVVQA